MKWSGPIGLLVTTLCMVYSMPPQTTTRYTSLEEYNRFSLNPIRNSDKKNSFNLSASNISSYFSESPLKVNVMNLTEQIRFAEQPNVNIFSSSAGTSRKLKHPTKNQTLYTNFVTNTFGNAATRNKTIKINSVNKVTTKVNKHAGTVTTKTVSKTSNLRPSIVKVPDSKNSSKVVLNVKKEVHVVTTKAPFRIKINKITTPTTKSPKTVYRRTTSVPLLIKLATRKPVTIKLSRPNVKNSTSSTKPKEKPTIHKIITKWSDSTDLSEVKQDWYENGVPYPNPNPEISSFSPPVSLSDVSSITPAVSDFLDNFNYPNPNPEITSFSPPISLSDISSISPTVGEYPENNYPNLNPEISSYSPPISLNELTSVSSLNNDYAENANYPSPILDVNSYSSSYSINDVPSIASDVPDIVDASFSAPSADAAGNPVSVFNLDMVSDGTKQGSTGGGSPCPTVHISSSVLASRQMECSDLNLVINSHFHQNQNGGGTRNPSISTYDGAQDAAAAPVLGDVPLAGEGEALGDPGVANSGAGLADPAVGAAEAADTAVAPQAPAAALPGGGTGGSGGSGGDGSNGSGGIKLPDLKNMFEAIGYLWNALRHLLSFLKNPYLYIIPMVLFFALGFFTILALFPWWIPLLMLYLSVKTHKTPKETVTFYNHFHKPIHHPDGWFWNHQTKTWQNVQDFVHKRNDHGGKRVDNIESIINRFKGRYEDNKPIVQTWKRRKRPK
ncbi:uncharacterized protein LOC108906441 [Anoplophora glabripennis]|uniref:uncharacterized protein LOC108906441 n=1 Tax=Anoplophora glabripennis TaxID=217634 RepID=UPI000874DCFB|nr:uncharacterized protein LOC108906441 [Anoplophora glabripennis]